MLTRALATTLLLSSTLSAQSRPLPDDVPSKPFFYLTIGTDDGEHFPLFAAWTDGAIVFDATPFHDNDYAPMLVHAGPNAAERVRNILEETGFASAPRSFHVVNHVSPVWHIYLYEGDKQTVQHSWNTGVFPTDYYKPVSDRWRKLIAALESDLPIDAAPAPREFRKLRLASFYPGCEWPFAESPIYPEPVFNPDAPLPTPITTVHDSQVYVRAIEHSLAENDHAKAWSTLQTLWPALTTPPNVLRRTGHLLPRLEPALKALADNHSQAHDFLRIESDRLFDLLANARTFDMQTHMLRPLSLCLDTALGQQERGLNWYRPRRLDRSIECQRHIVVSFWPAVKSGRNGLSLDRKDGNRSLRIAWEMWKELPEQRSVDMPNRAELLKLQLDRARQETASLYVAFLALGLDDRAAAVARIAEQHDPDRDFPCAPLLTLALNEGQFRPIHLEWIANASERGADVNAFLDRLRQNTARTPTLEGLSR